MQDEYNDPKYHQLEPDRKPLMSTISWVFLVLLLLAFFTPLGATLFLPLLITGFIAVGRYIKRSEDERAVAGEPKNPVITTIRILLKIAAVIAFGIMALIALVFIGFATGAIELDFGS